MKMVNVAPEVLADRLTFIDQKAVLKEMKAEGKDVLGVDGKMAPRVAFNAWADQDPTDVFNGVIGFRTVSIHEWLALPPYEANRPWEDRFTESGKGHLLGKLSNPLQTLGFGLVDEAGKLICRLDGNGRSGAWMAGALEKPEFLHVLTMVLPNGMTQGDYLVSNTFDILNGDAQKVSTDHRAIISKLRLIIKGEWVEFDSNFVKSVKATAFNDAKAVLNKPSGKKPSASDYIVCNKELVFLVDQLGIDTEEVKQKDLNGYTSTVFTMMLKTMAPEKGDVDNAKQIKAFQFWQQWGPDSQDTAIAELFEHTRTAPQGGGSDKKALRDRIEQVFKRWREMAPFDKSMSLPSYTEWRLTKAQEAKEELEKVGEEVQALPAPTSEKAAPVVEVITSDRSPVVIEGEAVEVVEQHAAPVVEMVSAETVAETPSGEPIPEFEPKAEAVEHPYKRDDEDFEQAIERWEQLASVAASEGDDAMFETASNNVDSLRDDQTQAAIDEMGDDE